MPDGFSRIMIMMIAMIVITLMSLVKYTKDTQVVRLDLTKQSSRRKRNRPK